jgi:hypothetical protein
MSRGRSAPGGSPPASGFVDESWHEPVPADADRVAICWCPRGGMRKLGLRGECRAFRVEDEQREHEQLSGNSHKSLGVSNKDFGKAAIERRSRSVDPISGHYETPNNLVSSYYGQG